MFIALPQILKIHDIFHNMHFRNSLKTLQKGFQKFLYKVNLLIPFSMNFLKHCITVGTHYTEIYYYV